MSRFTDDEREWLEADGLGGFAMGPVNGVRTRRYHGLLLSATTPPTGRMMLVNGFDAWVDTASGRYAISSQRYAGGVVHPDGASRIESFTADPGPAWTFRLDDGTLVRQEIIVPHEQPAALVTWRLLEIPAPRQGDGDSAAARLIVRPFLSGRDYHSTHHENGSIGADAHQADRVITPRTGKPVEVQALWLNALRTAAGAGAGSSRHSRWSDIYRRGRASFGARFWNVADGCLYDVVDVDHQPGRVDASCRPNQIFAVGGLSHPLIDGDRARLIVDTVERRLLTPLGLRTLAPGSPGYTAHYNGGPDRRDAAYHQGIVWPWLMGAFVDAWLRVRGRTHEARGEARARFLAPLMEHLERAGIGHVSEIADAESPFTPGGCPSQAWSLGELLRISEVTHA